jgi:5-methylcytosine-specific restriction enzyme subunit McrC
VKLFTLREREQILIPLDVVIRDGRIDIAEDVRSGRFFDLALRPAGLSLRAKGFIGFVPINASAVLEVRPKAPLANLTRMLKVANNSVVALEKFERLYSAADHELPGLVAILGGALVRALQSVEVEGLHKEYQEKRFNRMVGGRIDMPASFFYWGRGANHRAVVSAHQQSADTDVNRVLRAACNRVIQHMVFLGTRESKLLQALADYDEFFADRGVSLVRPERLSSPDARKLDRPYAAALSIAEMILKNRGVDLPTPGEDVALPSLLVDMELLFEDYVRAVLATRFAVFNGNAEGAKPLFDDRDEPPAKPDVVLLSHAGQTCAILDAKYKASISRDDVNQMIAYATTYRVNRVFVTAPEMDGGETRLEAIGRVGSLRIDLLRMNIGSSDPGSQESRFIDLLAGEIPELLGLQQPLAAS